MSIANHFFQFIALANALDDLLFTADAFPAEETAEEEMLRRDHMNRLFDSLPKEMPDDLRRATGTHTRTAVANLITALADTSMRGLYPAAVSTIRDAVKVIRDHLDAIGDEGQKPPAGMQQGEGEKPRTTKKRSTERGEGRFKLIAALIEHHKYANGSCLNPAPIGNNELAKAAVVSTSTASTFFNEQFKGHTKYKALCRDIGKLVHSLKLLSGEFSPHDLYGNEPPEKRRDGRRSRQESNDD